MSKIVLAELNILRPLTSTAVESHRPMAIRKRPRLAQPRQDEQIREEVERVEEVLCSVAPRLKLPSDDCLTLSRCHKTSF